MGKWLCEHFIAKNFTIPLDNGYSTCRNMSSTYSVDALLCSSIEKYGFETDQEIHFLSRTAPVRFSIEDREIYEAMLESGYIKKRPKHFILCHQLLDL